MTNTVRKTFVFCGIGFIALTVASLGYLFAQPRIQMGVSFDHAPEALAMRIIGDFHRDYNLTCSEKNNESGCRTASQVQVERKNYGDFLSIKKCTVRKVSEPAFLEASCTSSFSKGEALEYFLIAYRDDEDSYLLSYSIQLGEKNTCLMWAMRVSCPI